MNFNAPSKDESKPTGVPVEYVKITGENDGIDEYLLFLNIVKQIEKMLKAEGLIKAKSTDK